jgi:hypothetical protein
MKRWDEDLVKRGAQTKADRFKMMTSLGLNCPIYENVTIDNVQAMATKYYNGASIRCYGDGDVPNLWLHDKMEHVGGVFTSPPHIPVIKDSLVYHALLELLQKDWKPVITDKIAMEDNLFSGCIVTHLEDNAHFNTFILEAAVATPGNHVGVRNISHGGKVDIAVRLPNGIRGVSTGAFVDIYKYLKALRSGNWYLEFGYLRRPAGRLHDKPIFWDIYMVK